MSEQSPAPSPLPPERSAADLAAERYVEFQRHLSTLTPRAFVTPLLIIANFAVFAAMLGVDHGSFMTPKIETLLRFGASFGPRTANGQWWRLVTATFVHIGFFHIAMNMAVLWEIGRTVEKMLGNAAFLALYLVCGIAGELLSVAHSPMIVSAGASGAIFGLYGVLLGQLLRSRDSVPKEVLQRLQKSAIAFIAYNVLFGVAKSGIDNAAHIGGLTMGFLSGLAVAQPLTLEAAKKRLPRALAVSAAALIAMSLIATKLPKPFDVDAELHRFGTVEKQAVDRFKGAVDASKAGKLTDAAFADVIEKELLPPWREERARLTQPSANGQLKGDFVAYLEVRQRYWELLGEALRTNDMKLAKQAGEKADELERLLKQLSQAQ